MLVFGNYEECRQYINDNVHKKYTVQKRSKNFGDAGIMH